jgi:hypothetical protein
VLAEICSWTWSKAAMACPVGSDGTAPSEEAAPAAASAWRTASSTSGRRCGRRPAPS